MVIYTVRLQVTVQRRNEEIIIDRVFSPKLTEPYGGIQYLTGITCPKKGSVDGSSGVYYQ